MRVDSKPKWVPDWAWEEFLAYSQVGKHFLQSDLLRPTKAPPAESDCEQVSRRIIFDKDCATVWNAINRRRGEGKEPSIDGDCFSLLNTAFLGFRGSPTLVVVPGSERKRRGKKIAKLSTLLRDEIFALDEIGGVPMPIRQALATPLLKALQSASSCDFDKNLLDEAKAKLGKLDGDNCDALFLGVISSKVFLGKEENVLTSLAEGAVAWSATKPDVYRPDSAGAGREFFVQVMTRHFRNRYNLPLREQVAAITRCLYGGEIDASVVAKLAP